MSLASMYALAIVSVGGIVSCLLFWWKRASRFSIVFLLAAAFFAAMSSMFLTTDVVHNEEELRHVEFGWPLTFVTQNHSRYDPPYPVKTRWQWELSGDEEHPWMRFHWLKMAACVVFYAVLLYSAAWMRRRRELST